LRPGTAQHALRVDQNDRVVFFEEVEDRMPVDSATFERDMGDSVGPQPIGQGQQVRGHGQEGLGVLLHGAIGSSQQHTSHDGLFVYVSSGTAGVKDLHRKPPRWVE
jgi:hypothetical protein